jgi:membrane-associated PAP2 superfamily phosphatase
MVATRMQDGKLGSVTGAPRRRRFRHLGLLAEDRAVAAALLATLLLSAVFLAFPGLDRATSALFYVPGEGFPASDDPSLVALRVAGMLVTRLAVLALVGLFLAKLFAPRAVAAVPPRALLFLAASLTLGPGILVNLILKEYWGRVRPLQTDWFGGQHPFFPAWVPGGACLSNCSFVSGEASASFWLVALAFVVPAFYRREVLAVTLVWGVVVSLNRLAFGAHYLSDVTIAWALTLVVILALRRLVLIDLPSAADEAMDRRLAFWGARVRGWLGRGLSRPERSG